MAFSDSNLYVPLEDIEGAAYLIDKDQKITHCNNEFLKLLGVTKEAVIGKTIDKLDIYAADAMYQNNYMFMLSQATYSKVFEFISNNQANDKKIELLQSEKRIIRDDNGEIIGMLNIFNPNASNRPNSGVRGKTKHELREILNAIYGYIEHISNTDNNSVDKKSIQGLKRTSEKLTNIVDNLPIQKHQRTRSLWGDTSTQHWFRILSVSQGVLLLSPSIQSENDFQIENVDAVATSGEILQQSLMARAYPIILVDAKAFPLLQWDFKALNDRVAIIKITHNTEDQQYAGQYYTSVNLSELEKNYQTLLPKLWNDYTTEKTAKTVLENGLIRVLSIEDNFDSQSALENLLEAYKFIDITACTNANEALEALEKQEFDLIILDLGLPDASGYYLALHIRNIQNQFDYFFCPIIANTGHEFSCDTKQLCNCGINDFYRKPELLRNITALLAKYIPKDWLDINN